MSISIEQAILAEVLNRLTGTPLGPIPMPVGPDGTSLTVDRYRLLEVRPENLPHISIYPVISDAKGVGKTEEATEVRLASFARAKTTPVPESVDQALDPIWQWCCQQLLTDQSLGGLALRVEPTHRIWSANLAQRPFGDLDCHFLITHRHQAADPTRP